MSKSVEIVQAQGVESGMVELDAHKGLEPRVFFIASKYRDDVEYCTLSDWIENGDRARRYYISAYKAGDFKLERVVNLTSLHAYCVNA